MTGFKLDLKFSAFLASSAFLIFNAAASFMYCSSVIILTGNSVTVSQGTPTITADASVSPTGNAVTVSQNVNGITFVISGSVVPTGSELTISTGAEDVNVITWNPIDPNASQTWTAIDPL